MNNLVAAIRAAIDETEQLARKADDRESDWWWAPNGESAAEDHIARHDPAAVLRRCAADRKILDLHPLAWHKVTWPDEDGGFTGGRAEVCDTCMPTEVPSPAGGPCDTVLALAEAYGIEA